jgi:hypothetical protein
VALRNKMGRCVKNAQANSLSQSFPETVYEATHFQLDLLKGKKACLLDGGLIQSYQMLALISLYPSPWYDDAHIKRIWLYILWLTTFQSYWSIESEKQNKALVQGMHM